METKIFKTLNINGKEQEVIATSYSQIDTFLSCGHKWYLSYLLGQRENEKAVALDLGQAIHSTLEQYFNNVKDGKYFTVAEAQNMMAVNMIENDIEYPDKESAVEAETQHKEMIKGLVDGNSNLAKFMKDKEIVACEKDFIYEVKLPFKIKFKDKTYNKIYIIGSIDFIVKDKDDNLYVVDYKSGKKVFEQKKLKENLQLPIYSLVVNHIYGRLPVETKYYFTRFGQFQDVLPLAKCEEECQHIYYKNGKIKQQQRTIEDINNRLIEIFKEQYTTGKYKANSSPLCSWCSYGKYYKNNCNYAMFYKRKDIPLPKKNIKKKGKK